MSWITSPAPHRLLLGWGGHLTALYPTFPNQRPLAPTCHSHLLTGNWVFIRLPARGRCSVYLTQLSGKMVRGNLVRRSSRILACCRFGWPVGRGSAEIFYSHHRDFFIGHLGGNTLVIITCKWSNCANSTHNSLALPWHWRNERWW